jgi:polyhydroxyalkanoate synthesis regulator phasin
MQANVKNAVAGLVSNGTITQSQSDAVVQAYAQASANRQPGSGQYNSGQPGSGQPGSGQPGSGQRQNRILAPLVSNGTLTQTQANVVSQAIRQAMPHRSQIPGGQVTTQTTTQ